MSDDDGSRLAEPGRARGASRASSPRDQTTRCAPPPLSVPSHRSPQDVLDAYVTAGEVATDAEAAGGPVAAVALRALRATGRGAPDAPARAAAEPGAGLDGLLARAAAAAPAGALAGLLRGAVDALEARAADPRAALGLIAAAAAAAMACGAGDAAAAAAAALERATAAPWPTPAAAAVEALRSAPLTTPQADAIRARALRDALGGDPGDLPALARQLLALRPVAAAAGALLGLVALLDEVAGVDDARPAARDAASTVLLAIELAAKADPAAARSWAPALAARPRPSPAAAAVLLTLVGVRRLRDGAVDALVKGLTRAARADAAAACSPWAASLPRLPLPSAAALENAFIHAVERGGDGLSRSALALADALIEAGGSVAATLPPNAAAPPPADADPPPPAERCARLGVRLLVAAFGAGGRSARGDALALAAARLAAAAADGGGGAHIAVLTGMAASHGRSLGSSHADALRDALSLAAVLPPSRSADLLAGLWPACRAVPVARDAAALALRKAAFGRAAAPRAAAARGLLLLALAEARAGGGGGADDAGPSQAPLSQAAAVTGGGLTALQELSGFLRRALTQQATVRAALYDGAPAVAAADADAAGALAAVLGPHLAGFVRGGGDTRAAPPLRLDLAVAATPDGGRELEPLAELLICARRVVLAARGREGGSAAAAVPGDDAVSPLAAAFSSAIAVLTCSVPEDYGLDKSAGIGDATPEGACARARAASLTRCLEVAMADALAGAAAGDADVSTAADALAALFRVHDRLRALAATAPAGAVAGAGDKRPRGAPAARPPPPALSHAAAAALLDVMVNDGLPGAPAGDGSASPARGARLARDPAFQAFALRTAAALAAAAPAGAPGAPARSTLAPSLLHGATLVVLAYAPHRGRAAPAPAPRRGARDPGDGLPLLAVQAVAALLRGAAGPGEARALLGGWAGARGADALARLAEHGNHRETEALAVALASVAPALPAGERAALAGAARGALGRPLPHGPAVRALVGLLLAAASVDGDAPAAADVARAVGEVLAPAAGGGAGAAPAAPASISSLALPAIATKTMPAAAAALADALAAAVAEADWALARARAARAALAAAPPPPCVAAVDDACCARLTSIIAPLAILAGAPGLADAAPRAADRALAAVRGAYRALAAAARAAAAGPALASRVQLRPAFAAAVDAAHKALAPATATLLHDAENRAASSGAAGAGAARPSARAPDVVFAAEDLDARLIKLGAAAAVNLMKGARRAPARDFRIGGAGATAPPATAG